ncbi:MAG: glycerol-3-phosphate 1-O-acyltransferase PlsY [Clostridia bacterium]|nr:glycerol-3-phosphate 1-O-acyltransferase PlsY [Clostridia bacterium]
MLFLKYLLIAIGAYLLGSVSFSVLLSKGMAGGDVRKHGSGNAGATNMARVYGLGAGIKVLVGDMVKAGIPMLVGYLVCGEWGLAVAGMCAMVGHCFPIFHQFKGGKGVSVGGITAVFVDWRVGLLVVAGFVVGAFGSKKVSFGSVIGAVMITVGAVLFHISTPRLVLCAFDMCLVIWRHKENIKRLIKGTEPDFKAHK